jgi:heme O synthase-like polyprenyltransferase
VRRRDMKKKLFSLILIALLMLSLSANAFAETIPARTDLYVEYTRARPSRTTRISPKRWKKYCPETIPPFRLL